MLCASKMTHEMENVIPDHQSWVLLPHELLLLIETLVKRRPRFESLLYHPSNSFLFFIITGSW